VDGTLRALETLRDSGTTNLAMLTGRPLRELLELVGDLGIPMAGSHGFEFMAPGGHIEAGRLTAEQDSRLQDAERQALAVARGARVERKPASVGLHTRGLPESDALELHELVASMWREGAEEAGLECRKFSGGVELRLKTAHKGRALERLLEGRGTEALCVYVGDDETDEDAFAALPNDGIGIKVGPPDAPTGALGRLDDPLAVKEFLDTWIATTTR
jgi:trehalose-phosphatase